MAVMCKAGREARERRRLRVLHVLACSLPKLNGYTLRSKYVVETQSAQGRIEPIVATSPFYPGELPVEDEIIGGVRHYRVPHPVDGPAEGSIIIAGALAAAIRRLRRWATSRVGRLRLEGADLPAAVRRAGKFRWPLHKRLRRGLHNILDFAESHLLMRLFERRLYRIAKRERPDVIVAHTPYRCGRPARKVGRRLGIPFVYEVRGMWEDSCVAAGDFRQGDIWYRLWRRGETQVMRAAAAVTCVCEQIRADVVSRAVDPAKTFVVPNGADVSVFHPPGPAEQRSVSGPPGELPWMGYRGPVVGYVGSVRWMEGTGELVQAFAILLARGVDARLLVVGGGEDLEAFRRMARQQGVADVSCFTGPVPHAQVLAYYDRIDVFVVSRPDARVTRLVTPLKPYEAMALGKAVVAADLPAIREIVQDGRTGLLYPPDDVEQLADLCQRLIEDEQLRLRLGRSAAQWVRHNRTWSATVPLAEAAYRLAVTSRGRVSTGRIG